MLEIGECQERKHFIQGNCNKKFKIAKTVTHCYNIRKETKSEAAYLPLSEGFTALQTKERRAIFMYVTYSDLIQIGMFIVALVSLCYQIFKDKRK